MTLFCQKQLKFLIKTVLSLFFAKKLTIIVKPVIGENNRIKLINRYLFWKNVVLHLKVYKLLGILPKPQACTIIRITAVKLSRCWKRGVSPMVSRVKEI